MQALLFRLTAAAGLSLAGPACHVLVQSETTRPTTTERASLIGGDAPAVRVVLPLRNDGPGDAWAVRGQITAPGAPAIDGRMIYVGKLARGASVSRELVIPVEAKAAAALRGQVVDLSVELRDAHGTAPPAPVRFHGILLGDVPRGSGGP